MEVKRYDKVRVVGKGNTIWEVADDSSPILGEWIVRKPNGSMMSVHPSKLKLVVKK